MGRLGGVRKLGVVRRLGEVGRLGGLSAEFTCWVKWGGRLGCVKLGRLGEGGGCVECGSWFECVGLME